MEQQRSTKSEKMKIEMRRFVLVFFEGITSPCFVSFEKLSFTTHSSDVRVPDLDARTAACFTAAAIRKPGTVHQAIRGEALKLNPRDVRSDCEGDEREVHPAMAGVTQLRLSGWAILPKGNEGEVRGEPDGGKAQQVRRVPRGLAN
eukprot:5310273-Pleurochrysis_carterae.AAC.6